MDQNKKKLKARPPVVVVMGHIDHGKSTLLDYIRKTSVTEKEEGGITQHISAYEAECKIGDQKRIIIFLDTPGHEAFCTVRERGVQVADIAILVVSADDGVKPQTIEAIDCIKKNSMPFIVALNKIDRAGANIDKVKQDLAENGVLVEGWGGTIPIVPISAKTGEGILELLEMIALQSDIEGFKGDPDVLAEGFVIESNLNPKQGISATLIIKDGSLKAGMFVATLGAYAPVRAIQNYKGENMQEASFSNPIKIVGWSAQPGVGSQFKTFSGRDSALEFSARNEPGQAEIKQDTIPEGLPCLNMVVKADTLGSLEALEYEFQKLSDDKFAVKTVFKGVGNITESDIKTAKIKNCLVLGFNVENDKNAEVLAMRDKIEIKIFKIIYELMDYVREKTKEAVPIEIVQKVVGSAKILKTFSKNKDRQVVGGRVDEGEIKSGGSVNILRRDTVIGSGKIKELQIQKVKTDSVKENQEFGIMIESKTELAQGDIIQAISLIKQ